MKNMAITSKPIVRSRTISYPQIYSNECWCWSLLLVTCDSFSSYLAWLLWFSIFRKTIYFILKLLQALVNISSILSIGCCSVIFSVSSSHQLHRPGGCVPAVHRRRHGPVDEGRAPKCAQQNALLHGRWRVRQVVAKVSFDLGYGSSNMKGIHNVCMTCACQNRMLL